MNFQFKISIKSASKRKIVFYHKLMKIVVFTGGPLIKADDGTVIGITNFFAENKNEEDPQKRYGIQGFANLRYHFKWISHVTGLELPKCRRSLHDEIMFKFAW